jgi:hypothetical protein
MWWLVQHSTNAPNEITMDKQFSHLLTLGKGDVERRFSELMNELSFLFASFPHLSDAFDADELPVSFIIKRDSRGAQVTVVRRHRSAPLAVTTPVNPQIKGQRRKASSRAIDRE